MPSTKSRLLTLFFAGLLVLNVGELLLGFASLPRYYERVTSRTVEPYSLGETTFASNARFQQEAAQRGMSLSLYAVEQTLFVSAIVVLFVAVAAVIVWRARQNWFAWYTAFFLVFIAEAAFQDQIYVARLVPLWVYEGNAIFWPFMALYLFLFPNGRPVPRRGLWLVLAIFLVHAAFQIAFAYLSAFALPEVVRQIQAAVPILNLLISIQIGLILICQVYRFLRVSSPLEKQQTKWFLFGLVLFIVLSDPEFILGRGFAYSKEVGWLVFAFLPLSVGIAITRYRLWDIDVIIRRTLIYGVLTALLIAIYFIGVTVIQALLSSVSGQRSEIAIIISTLAIAALFNPLRHGVQRVIDRRFYRRKYDAQKILAHFGTTVRDEVDLTRLTNELLTTVEETMQPASVNLSLRETRGTTRTEATR